MGTVRTRNKLHSLVSEQADYIVILDSDDIALEKRIEIQLDYLQKNCECVGCGTGMEVIDKNGSVIGGKVCGYKKNFKKYVATWNPFVQSSMMLRADIFQKVGLYDETLTRGEDHDMWLRILDNGLKLVVIPEVLTQFRVHVGQGKSAKSRESYRQYAKVRRRYIFKPDFFSPKGFLVATVYSILAFVPGFIMVWLYKNIYAK